MPISYKGRHGRGQRGSTGPKVKSYSRKKPIRKDYRASDLETYKSLEGLRYKAKWRSPQAEKDYYRMLSDRRRQIFGEDSLWEKMGRKKAATEKKGRYVYGTMPWEKFVQHEKNVGDLDYLRATSYSLADLMAEYPDQEYPSAGGGSMPYYPSYIGYGGGGGGGGYKAPPTRTGAVGPRFDGQPNVAPRPNIPRWFQSLVNWKIG